MPNQTHELSAELKRDLAMVVGVCCADVKSGYSFEAQPIFDLVAKQLSLAHKQGVKETLEAVEDILPYSVGFTGRFYTLKEELLKEPYV